MKTKATPSVEMMLRNLGSAIAALDQLDPGAIAEDGRLKFIADQLRGHADRIARWSKRYAVIWFDVGNIVQEMEAVAIRRKLD